MWFRAFLISCLNIVATMVAIVLLLSFVIPAWLPMIVRNLFSWTMAVIVGWICAHWIFAKKMPTDPDILTVCIVHAIVFCLAYLAYGIFLFPQQGPRILLSVELLVQVALECAIILIEGYRLKRRRLQAAFGEGMTV